MPGASSYRRLSVRIEMYRGHDIENQCQNREGKWNWKPSPVASALSESCNSCSCLRRGFYFWFRSPSNVFHWSLSSRLRRWGSDRNWFQTQDVCAFFSRQLSWEGKEKCPVPTERLAPVPLCYWAPESEWAKRCWEIILEEGGLFKKMGREQRLCLMPHVRRWSDSLDSIILNDELFLSITRPVRQSAKEDSDDSNDRDDTIQKPDATFQARLIVIFIKFN